MSNKVFNLNKHTIYKLSTWLLDIQKPIYFYSSPGFETSLLIASTKELNEEEVKILIDAYLVTDKSDLITDPDEPIWETGEDIDFDWFFL